MKAIIIIIISIFLGAVFLLNSCERNPLETGGKKLASINLKFNFAWGTEGDDNFAGSVVDADGNMYILSGSTSLNYVQKIHLTKISLINDSLIWSKTISSPYSLFFPTSSYNGLSHDEASSKYIATDQSGNVYIAGTCTKGYNQVFVLKVNPQGNLLWQRNWEPDNSGLAQGSAMAFAIDINNNRVYITGSTGGGTSSEEAMAFLLMLDVWSGEILDNTSLGIDPSTGSNDCAYAVKANKDRNVYLAGWEGKNNSGLLIKYSADGDEFEWCKRIDLGTGGRIIGIDLDEQGDIYLACDFKGNSTYLGILKLNAAGSYIWGKKYQGRSNEINNISCLRVLNGHLYVGGRGSFEKYDLSKFGDGCLLKLDFLGNLINEMNYFTGEEAHDNSGQRIKSINYFDGNLILSGNTWSDYKKIAGHWYIPKGKLSDFTPNITTVTNIHKTLGFGWSDDEVFNIDENFYNIFPLSEGNKGPSDLIIFKIAANNSMSFS